MSDRILQIVSTVVSDTFHVPADTVTRDLVAADVQGWDSLAHARIILGLEQSLGLRLPVRRAFDAANVGALCDLIADLGVRP